MLLSRILGGLGRTLVTAGTLILLFVAYQLWGTNIHTARAQNALDDEFAEVLATVPPTTTTSTTSVPPTIPGDPNQVDVVAAPLVPADLPLPEYGDPIAQIKIPKIGVDHVVVEGVGLDQLKRGPGHYQETPLPGQAGNSAIAGHRTTYGAPFHNVDKLEVGDQIIVQTMQGEFVYEVDIANLIVKPSQVEVLEDKGD
jgi:sortase A